MNITTKEWINHLRSNLNMDHNAIVAKLHVDAIMQQDATETQKARVNGQVQIQLQKEFVPLLCELLRIPDASNEPMVLAVITNIVFHSPYSNDLVHVTDAGNDIFIPLCFFEGASAMIDVLHDANQ